MSLIGIKDIIDILLVAVLLFEAFQILRRSGAVNLFWGIFAFIIMWVLVVYVFHLELTGSVFNFIGSAGAVALVVIFQSEIRAVFIRVGARMGRNRLFQRINRTASQDLRDAHIGQITMACHHMSASKTGALIVICRQNDLESYSDTGEKIDSTISARMIENIFFKNTPLHDGAMIIQGGKIHAAACILPVSRNLSIPKQYGLRHRAALGLSEKTDAIAIVVSEETGEISWAENGQISPISAEELTKQLSRCLFNSENK